MTFFQNSQRDGANYMVGLINTAISAANLNRFSGIATVVRDPADFFVEPRVFCNVDGLTIAWNFFLKNLMVP